jgi:hypothetical protein
VTGQRAEDGAYWAGYQRGIETGHATGYAEGLSVLDDAAGALAQLRPSKSMEIAAARARRAQRSGASLTPAEIRIRAAQSWGLPVPADLVDQVAEDVAPEPASSPPADELSAAEPAVPELADDEGLAWSG